MTKARRLLFFAALFLLSLIFLVEVGSGIAFGSIDISSSRPGLGIRYLALLDGLLLFSVILLAMPLLISHRLHGRVQGVLTLIISFLVLILAIAMVITAVALLSIMVALLLAVPFGTIAYMATFAHFPVAKAATILSAIFIFKIAFACCLILSQEQYLQNRGLMVTILMSIGMTMLLTVLHGLPPRFLVFITDNIGGVIIAIVSIIWSLWMLIASLPAIFKAIKVSGI